MILFGILFSFATLSFQNCGQVKLSTPDGSSSNVTVIGKLSNSQAFAAIGHLDPRDPGHGPLLYDIQENGHVDVYFYEAPDQPVTGSCTLTADHLAQLTAYVARSSICYYEPTSAPGTICTMEYGYPYARVESEGITYKLGERTSGCSDTFELCGEDRYPFRAFLNTVIQDLDANCTLN